MCSCIAGKGIHTSSVKVFAGGGQKLKFSFYAAWVISQEWWFCGDTVPPYRMGAWELPAHWLTHRDDGPHHQIPDQHWKQAHYHHVQVWTYHCVCFHVDPLPIIQWWCGPNRHIHLHPLSAGTVENGRCGWLLPVCQVSSHPKDGAGSRDSKLLMRMASICCW